ncbi:hypothetical protein JKP88DRAFT_352584 [Tribonema minus]|uniref:Uncharacterized protein n=1 Tax=Tribonema minus TaxID=303371 RepID=A0A835ZD07_9STRA|nr:hypothetical protein JKP88DRAFT_352584 [Tribonema minus]
MLCLRLAGRHCSRRLATEASVAAAAAAVAPRAVTAAAAAAAVAAAQAAAAQAQAAAAQAAAATSIEPDSELRSMRNGGKLSVPVLGYWIATGDYKTALGGLAVASASDWLDGYLARRLNQKTVLGGILDPLADKLMVATVSVALGAQGLLPMPLVALMFGRDFLLIGGSIVHRARTKSADEGFFDLERADEGFFDLENLDWEVKPSLISKANTALQATYALQTKGGMRGGCSAASVRTCESAYSLGWDLASVDFSEDLGLEFVTLWAALSQEALGWPGFVTLWAALSQGALGWPGADPLHYLCVTTGAATLASGASYFVNSGIVTRSRGRVLTKVRAGREKIAHQREIVRSKVLEKREKLAEKSGRMVDFGENSAIIMTGIAVGAALVLLFFMCIFFNCKASIDTVPRLTVERRERDLMRHVRKLHDDGAEVTAPIDSAREVTVQMV